MIGIRKKFKKKIFLFIEVREKESQRLRKATDSISM